MLETDIIKMSQPVSRLRKTKHLAINQQQQEQQRHYHPEQSNVSDPLSDRKIEDVASGLVNIIQMGLAKCHCQIKKML